MSNGAPVAFGDSLSRNHETWIGTVVLSIVRRSWLKDEKTDGGVPVSVDEGLQHGAKWSLDGGAELTYISVPCIRPERPTGKPTIGVKSTLDLADN